METYFYLMKVKPISYFYCFIKNAPVKILDMPISFNMDFLIKAYQT